MHYNRIVEALVLIVFTTAVLPGCSKDKSLPAETGRRNTSVREFIAAESNTTIFNAAFLRSGMLEDSAWLSGGPYTYFVPTDDAFTAAEKPLSVINSMDKTDLLKMLKYMIVKGRISSTTLAGFFRQSAATLSPDRPMLTKNYYGIFFNGIAMQEPNINLGDAVVHTMKNVGLPPAGSVLEIIRNNPELSIFSAIIAKGYNAPSSNYNRTLKHLFETNGKTIFAPTNDAFIRYGITSVQDVDNEDPRILADLVRGQVYVGYYDGLGNVYDNAPWICTISDFKGGFLLAELSDPSNPVSVREDGLTIKAPYNYPDIRIVKADLLAKDGAVQEIDQVILR